MSQPSTPQPDQRIHFVARRYHEGSLDTNAAWKQFAGKQGIRPAVPLRRYLAGAVAVLLAVVGFGTLYVIRESGPEWVQVTADAGQVKDVFLPDSTMVTLTADSWIRYDKKQYRKKERAVEMNGKAFFRVQRDEARPFLVQTERTEVEVLGTAFQLDEQSADRTELYVESGKVSFSTTDLDPVILTAGMSAVYSVDTDEITVTTAEEPNILAWKTLQFVFHETPIDRVIHDLEACHQVKIIPKTSLANGLKLTASFDDMPLSDILFIINQTLDTDLTAYPVHQ